MKMNYRTNQQHLQHQITRQQQQQNCFIYTHHLPYAVRKSICDLLDADQSWRTLAGQYARLNATQIALLGQAYLRNGSPSNELLCRLDSENFPIKDLCFCLQQMNHFQALEQLKPFAIERDNQMMMMMMMDHDANQSNQSNNTITTTTNTTNTNKPTTTLTTPTPSFADLDLLQRKPAAIMCSPSDDNDHNQQLLCLNSSRQASDYLSLNLLTSNNRLQQQQAQRFASPTKETNPFPYQEKSINTSLVVNNCHKNNSPNHHPQQQQVPEKGLAESPAAAVAIAGKPHDPGEEIVRMACANNRKRTSISDQEVVNQLRLIMQINYNELKQASNDFSNKNILGNGGFASVYRGHWKGTDVAIKRLKCNLMDQALNELTILNSYRIDNILPIYGISIDGPEACLVYQFMANGSLEDRLSCKGNTKPLSWSQRASIGEGVAKGLYYLHTLRDKPLVHGDVKSANVLLDSQYEPKLGDFGLARQVFKGKNPQTELCTSCTVSSIHGTSVYLPPEYLRHKILSPAVDVYSYGIVLLEMATGRRAYDGKQLLIELVEEETRSMELGQIGYKLKDSRLSDETQSDLRIFIELLIRLGKNCAHKIKKKRPVMGEVLARFVEFRNSSAGVMASSSNHNINNNILIHSEAVPPPMTTVAAAATTTFDLINSKGSTLQATNHNQDHRKLDIGTSLRPKSQTLMSVEEESELLLIDPQEATSTPVDGMIPLLTELGLQMGD